MDVLKFILRRRRPVIVIHFVLALAMLPGVLQLENDNSPGIFFARDAGALQDYREFRQQFPGGQAVRVALGGPGLWTREGLAWLTQLEERAASLPGVEAALGPAARYRWLLPEWPPPDPTAFRKQVVEDELNSGAGWVSSDGDTVTMLIVIADLDPAAGRELLNRLESLTADPPPGIQAHLSGLPILHLAMDRSLLVMVSRFLPLLVLLAAAFLAFIFRCRRSVAVPLVFAALFHTILFGIMGFMGAHLNLVNIILAPLLFVISLATAVHLLVHFRRLVQQGKSAAEAVMATYRSKGRPVLWTGFTTLAAFGSLVTGSVPPVRSLGAWCAVGIVLMTVLAFSLYPALLGGLPAKIAQTAARPFETRTRRLGRTWAQLAVRHRPRVLAAAAATLIFALAGIAQLRVEDNIGRYFPKKHPVRAELERLQEHGVGVFAAELILSYGSGPYKPGDEQDTGFLEPLAQQRLARLSAILRSKPPVYGAVSSGDLVETAIRSILVQGEVNEKMRWMALGLIQTVQEGRKLLHTLVTPDGRYARVTLLVPILSFHRMQPLFEEAKAAAKKLFPGARVRVTGQYPLVLLAQRKLLHGLILSLSLTLLCVALVFRLLLRSTRLTLRVLVPNLWPIALVLGAMGWLGLPLDSASVMTASIVLGLAVDDTFHTLGHFLGRVHGAGSLPVFGKLFVKQETLSAVQTDAAAIVDTLERTAPAHILTTVILAAGFAACSFSDLLPVSRMGAISVAAILLALIGDLLLIPALLAGRK